ncbi:MAG: flagellar export chaperone FliS [Aeromonadaceae bacterium]|nr:flagellar export chaperone FliS [Aeromonadaceae bacterium]
MYNRRNLKAYKTTSLDAELAVADPHRVIQMLMQGALERVAQAKGAIERRDYEAKSYAISKAMAIINGLQDSLDLSHGQVPQDMMALYIYMKDRLTDASTHMDVAPLDEVTSLMSTIKSAWDQIPESVRQKAYAQQQSKGTTA